MEGGAWGFVSHETYLATQGQMILQTPVQFLRPNLQGIQIDSDAGKRHSILHLIQSRLSSPVQIFWYFVEMGRTACKVGGSGSLRYFHRVLLHHTHVLTTRLQHSMIPSSELNSMYPPN